MVVDRMQRASSRTRSMSSRVQRLTRVRSCARRSALAKTTKKAATGASKRRKSSSTSVSMAEGKLAVIEIEDSSHHSDICSCRLQSTVGGVQY